MAPVQVHNTHVAVCVCQSCYIRGGFSKSRTVKVVNAMLWDLPTIKLVHCLDVSSIGFLFYHISQTPDHVIEADGSNALGLPLNI